MRARARLAFVGTACLCTVLGVTACSAQTQTTARLAGTVRDATGAVIVRAEVVAQNSATGEKRTATTDGSGDYVLTSLSPGTYHLRISATGFSAALYTSIEAGSSGTVTINAILKVANPTSDVTVTDTPHSAVRER